MGSRTQIRLEMMRQKVLEDEKCYNNLSTGTNMSYFNNNSSDPYLGNNCLPSLNSTLTSSDQTLQYCKPFLESPTQYQINQHNLDLYNSNHPQPPNSVNYSIPSINHISSPGSAASSSNYLYNSHQNNVQHHSQPYYNHHHPSTNLNLNDNLPNNYLNGLESSFSCPVTPNANSHRARTIANFNNSTNMLDYNTSPLTNGNSGIYQLSPSLTNTNVNSATNNNSGQTVDDKRLLSKDKSKKESHNRIERRRRDFINQQIIELSNLIPAQKMSDGDSRKNKGNILKNSVDYIQYLQNETAKTNKLLKETELAFIIIDSYRKRISELENQLHYGTPQQSPYSHDSLPDSYSQYLQMHETNMKIYQQLHSYNYQSNINTTTSNTIRKLSNTSNSKLNMDLNSTTTSTTTTTNNNLSFKLEPSSAHSSLGNNFIVTNYRIGGEESVDSDIIFSPLTDVLSPSHSGNNSSSRVIDQNIQTQNSFSSGQSDSYISGSQYKTIYNNFESMEC